MGRPLNKKFFGTGPGLDLKIQANIGSGPVEGHIARQRGSKRFEVNAGGDTGVCVLVDKEVADLLPGEMSISARNTGGNVKRIVKIAARKATLGDGVVVAWDFAAASAGKVEIEEEADTFSNPVAPVITITTQPASQTRAVGQTATFSVVATITPTATLNYQWRLNGNVISGATSATYTTPALILADDGAIFTVTVSSSEVAPVTSADAVLTVEPS